MSSKFKSLWFENANNDYCKMKPMQKKFGLRKEFFGRQKLGQQIKCWAAKSFWVEKNVGPKKMLAEKKCWAQKIWAKKKNV